ncbi:hypothetical protein BF49_7048 [Bradyrhizobium sp.]|nr:hypothetical protein BF49_7048 [Bradyrhizobium sp.]
MAMAMFQISEASLGGERTGKLVRGRTKNWMEGARHLGRRLPKNCSRVRDARGTQFRIRGNQIVLPLRAICTIRESFGEAS